MQCQVHVNREAKGACIECGNFFCNDCLIKVKNKNHCKSCAAELLGDTEAGKRSAVEPKPMVFQQQQQQQQNAAPATVQSTATPYNWQPVKTVVKWLIGLILLIAMFGEFSQKYYVAGILSLLLGLYWIPPIQDTLHKMVKEKYAFVISTWARNLVSLIIFFIIIFMKF